MIRADQLSPTESARRVQEALNRVGFACELPRPPSVNSLFRNPSRRDRKPLGRIKTKAYEAWIAAAGWTLRAARPPRFTGAYELTIAFGRRKGADLDNFAKAIGDLLVSVHVVRDDSDCERMTLSWADDLPANRCRIEVKEAKPPRG